MRRNHTSLLSKRSSVTRAHSAHQSRLIRNAVCSDLQAMPSHRLNGPRTDIGDVIVHHMAPKVWRVAAVTTPGDLRGRAMTTYLSRAAAMAAAHALRLAGRRIYIRHHDDAQWEHVE